ncbi:MAG: hypothetical protein NC114_10870 [Ruminococcus flavefaciens]|nr:hypothetical protein [Ruminococcus flavefaciens]
MKESSISLICGDCGTPLELRNNQTLCPSCKYLAETTLSQSTCPYCNSGMAFIVSLYALRKPDFMVCQNPRCGFYRVEGRCDMLHVFFNDTELAQYQDGKVMKEEIVAIDKMGRKVEVMKNHDFFNQLVKGIVGANYERG